MEELEKKLDGQPEIARCLKRRLLQCSKAYERESSSDAARFLRALSRQSAKAVLVWRFMTLPLNETAYLRNVRVGLKHLWQQWN